MYQVQFKGPKSYWVVDSRSKEVYAVCNTSHHANVIVHDLNFNTDIKERFMEV